VTFSIRRPVVLLRTEYEENIIFVRSCFLGRKSFPRWNDSIFYWVTYRRRLAKRHVRHFSRTGIVSKCSRFKTRLDRAFRKVYIFVRIVKRISAILFGAHDPYASLWSPATMPIVRPRADAFVNSGKPIVIRYRTHSRNSPCRGDGA